MIANLLEIIADDSSFQTTLHSKSKTTATTEGVRYFAIDADVLRTADRSRLCSAEKDHGHAAFSLAAPLGCIWWRPQLQ